MYYLEHSANGFISTRNTVKLYDIVQPRVGYWKGKIAIVTQVKSDTKHLHVRIIENGMDLFLKVKDVVFINHNNRTAAKSYFELCEKMRANFIEKYKNIDYIKEHFDDDPLMCNDITATTICRSAGIYISNNPNQYPTKALNWLASHKELISGIIRIPDIKVLEEVIGASDSSYANGIIDSEHITITKLYRLFYGTD